MERLRVLYLINDLRAHGGAEIAMANLVNNLDHNQLEVWVGGLFKKGTLVGRLDLPSECVLSFDFRRRFYLDLASLWKLACFLRQHRIQVIHTHLFASNTAGRIAAWLAGVPVIVATEHNTYLHKGRLSVKIDRVLAHVTTQMTAVSEGVRSFAARQAGLSLDRFVVIPNGVPLEQIPVLSADQKRQKQAALGIEEGQQVIISIGRLTEQKGFPVLIQAARRVLEKYPSTLFFIVGTGSLEDDLRRQIERSGLEGSVRLLGYRSDIYELSQISTLLVMPSLWEGLPVVLIEAGACGLPTVASNVGGVAEVVQDGESGVLVQPGDEYGLAAAIGRLLAAPETRQRMGECGRRLVEERFSARRVARQTTDLYWQLWRSQRGKRRKPLWQ